MICSVFQTMTCMLRMVRLLMSSHDLEPTVCIYIYIVNHEAIRVQRDNRRLEKNGSLPDIASVTCTCMSKAPNPSFE